MKKPKVNIGIEIEVNNLNGLDINSDFWAIDNEHCGFELRSKPCKSPAEIRGLIRSIKKMAVGATTSFENTGTHIHIDFLNDANVSPSDLTRLTVPRGEKGNWINPLGTGKKYMWASNDGQFWKAPKDYLLSKSLNITPGVAYVNRGRYVESVKRFFLLGKRFSSVLFGMQSSCRRFNKYCHTIAHWDEDILMSCNTIQDISNSSKLLQRHRRHMFNPIAFRKFGTIEVRMIKGTLDSKIVWEQVYLFGKLAQLAKSDKYIPTSTGSLIEDFVILMGACGIHGKMRRQIESRFMFNARIPHTEWRAKCFKCETNRNINRISDFGLSRPICLKCLENYSFCAWCGYTMSYGGGKYINTVGGHRRYLCHMCVDVGHRRQIKLIEKDKVLCLMGEKIGSGIDKKGPMTLRRLREVFG